MTKIGIFDPRLSKISFPDSKSTAKNFQSVKIWAKLFFGRLWLSVRFQFRIKDKLASQMAKIVIFEPRLSKIRSLIETELPKIFNRSKFDQNCFSADFGNVFACNPTPRTRLPPKWPKLPFLDLDSPKFDPPGGKSTAKNFQSVKIWAKPFYGGLWQCFRLQS